MKPLPLSEADVVFQLRTALAAAGATIRQEVVLPLDTAPSGALPPLRGKTKLRASSRRNTTVRVDLAVFQGDSVVAAVEVKKTKAARHKRYTNWQTDDTPLPLTQQGQKYRRLGIPFTFCCGVGEVRSTVAWVLEILKPPA